ncbi:MAG TPA: DNA alkylation repair protein [Candidatus Limnocylindria bacterium]|nr:DNA alkylation repair protein [Candidatus Limnocylindria bacterium]
MTDHTAATQAASIETRLRDVGTPERAIQERRYLKSSMDFLGATVWQIRAVVKAYLAEIGDLDHDGLVALVDALWTEPIHERRMAATVLLELRSGLLTVADLPLVERLLRESLTWALVDGLAADVVGDLLVANAAGTVPVLDRWAVDDDFWIRRSALLAWLRPLRAGAPLDRFLSYGDRMLDEREFFIRKAIGWVLREVGKRRPEEVADWLASRTQRASGVTMREATKYLPPPVRDRLMAAYRERRPARP